MPSRDYFQQLCRLLIGRYACLPPLLCCPTQSGPATKLEFCRHGKTIRESRKGPPAPCQAVNEKNNCSEAKNSRDLIRGCHHSLLLGWRQGRWERYVTCPKPQGNAVTQIQPLWMPCPGLSLHHNTLPTFPLFTARISPFLSSLQNLHYILTT